MKQENSYIRRYIKLLINCGRQKIFVAFLFMIIAAAIEVFLPMMVEYLIDAGIVKHNIEVLFYVTISYIICSLLVRVINIYVNNYFEKLKLTISMKLKKILIKKLTLANGNYISQQNTGNLLYILDNDIYQIENFGIEIFFQLMMNVITACIVFIILVNINFKMLIIVIIIQITMIILQKIFSSKITEGIKDIRDISGRISNLQEQFISNLKTVVLSNVTGYFQKIFFEEQTNYYNKSKKTNLFIILQRECVGFLQSLSLIVSYLVGGIIIVKGKMTLGQLVAFIQYINLLIAPCILIINSNIRIKQIKVSLERVYQEIDSITITEENKKAIDVNEIKKICFEKVNFSYFEKEILKDINIEFKKESITGIVGESGCGKTTLINILYGLWCPQSGKVYINSIPYENFNIKKIRQKICIICQDSFLFNTSILNNIKLGNEKIDNNEINKLLKIVELNTLMKENEDSFVGEKGNNLSGGQKQKIVLARALARESDVFIFDEATSSLDNLSQSKIMDSLLPYFRGKIVIIIAHRLSTLKCADRIIVMNKGRIVESGTKEYLINKKGLYLELEEAN